MSKCLITKLKAAVDNPNLEVFGELVLNCHVGGQVSQSKWIHIDPLEDVKLTLEGATFVGGGTELIVNAGDHSGKSFYRNDNGADKGDVKIKINSKYAITVLGLGLSNSSIEPVRASTIEYCPFDNENYMANSAIRLELIFDTYSATRKILSNGYYLNNSVNLRYVEEDSDFDLSWLSGLPIRGLLASSNVVNGQIIPIYVRGDIASLGNCTNLQLFNFWNSYIYGAIENFVAGQRAAGRTEGIITVDAYQGNNSHISLGSATRVIVGDGVGRIKWDSTHIAYYNGNIDDIDDAAVTTIACIGYTDSQIETWRNAGKTVTKCD